MIDERMDEITPELLAWGRYIISKVDSGEMFGSGKLDMILFKIVHETRTVILINGLITDDVYLTGAIFKKLGYSLLMDEKNEE